MQYKNNVFERYDNKIENFNDRFDKMIRDFRRTGNEAAKLVKNIPVPRLTFNSSTQQIRAGKSKLEE